MPTISIRHDRVWVLHDEARDEGQRTVELGVVDRAVRQGGTVTLFTVSEGKVGGACQVPAHCCFGLFGLAQRHLVESGLTFRRVMFPGRDYSYKHFMMSPMMEVRP